MTPRQRIRNAIIAAVLLLLLFAYLVAVDVEVVRWLVLP